MMLVYCKLTRMSSTEQEQAFWNADDMVAYFAAKPADPVIVDRLARVPATPNMNALDLGCGGGRHSELLAQHGFNVTSVDVNPAMLRHTAERLQKQNLTTRLARMSIVHLGLASDQYDVVVSTGVLHQAKSLGEYDRAVAEVSRVMHSGGLFTMNIFTNSVWDSTYIVPSPDEPGTVVTQEGLWMTLLSREDFYSLAADHDLQLEEEVTEDVRQENTGPRAVLRAHFLKT